jgi:hypothetical protein
VLLTVHRGPRAWQVRSEIHIQGAKTLRLNKKTIAVSAIALTISGGGVAYAYFSSIGSGTGTATVGAPEASAVTMHSVFSAPEIGADSAVTYTADGAAKAVTIHAVKTEPALTVTPAPGTGTCPAGSFTLGSATWGTFPFTVEASTPGQQLGTAALTFHDLPENQDGCKGATLAIDFAVN